MKKNLGRIGLLFILVLSLVACSGQKKEEVVSYTHEGNGVSITITFYHTGDKVNKQVVESTINYEKTGSDKETIKKASEDYVNLYKDIDGIKYDINIGETEALETTEYDYNKIDFKKLASIPGVNQGEIDENTKMISLKKSEEQIKNMGFKLKTK